VSQGDAQFARRFLDGFVGAIVATAAAIIVLMFIAAILIVVFRVK
jgi:hypothetical protein